MRTWQPSSLDPARSLRLDLADFPVTITSLTEWESARALILTGFEDLSPTLPAALAALRSCGRPLIAVIDGPLVGEASELALLAPWRIGTRRATFAFPLLAAPGPLGAIIGRDRQLELRLTGRVVDAVSAAALGLLQVVVETKDAALRRAAQLAEQIGAGSPTATRLVIGAVEQGASRSLAAGLAVETRLFARSIVSADAREGIEAFFDKRPPSFDGQ